MNKYFVYVKAEHEPFGFLFSYRNEITGEHEAIFSNNPEMATAFAKSWSLQYIDVKYEVLEYKEGVFVGSHGTAINGEFFHNMKASKYDHAEELAK